MPPISSAHSFEQNPSIPAFQCLTHAYASDLCPTHIVWHRFQAPTLQPLSDPSTFKQLGTYIPPYRIFMLTLPKPKIQNWILQLGGNRRERIRTEKGSLCWTVSLNAWTASSRYSSEKNFLGYRLEKHRTPFMLDACNFTELICKGAFDLNISTSSHILELQE